MAAPTYRASYPSSSGLTDAGGNWSFNATSFGSPTLTVGDILILQILQDGTTNGAITVSVQGGAWIEDLAGTDTAITQITGPNADGSFPIGSAASARQFLYIGRVLTTTHGGFDGTNSTSEDLYLRTYAFSNVSTGTTLATVIENSTAGSTANTNATNGTITDAGVTTLGPDRLALQFIGISDDNALASFTGETGGDWTEAVAEYAESSGTDATIGLQTATITSVGTINGGTTTNSDATDGWGVVGFALIGTTVSYQPRHPAIHFNDPAIV